MATQDQTEASSQTASPLERFVTPLNVDLWSFAATLYEMATSCPLFGHSYDRVTTTARAEMLEWRGLSRIKLEQIELQHGRSEATALVDLLQWCLDADPSQRPATIAAVLDHAFFNPEKGSLREDFTVQRLRLLIKDPAYSRTGCNVMVSYCWADTDFVLGKLAPELAVSCKSLWLDRLGGEQGMGEWAVESMERGVKGADAVVAVVSPAYIKSVNCGKELGFAAASGTTVVPIVLGVPFSKWPPRQIGQTTMQDQFQAATGDLKIFVDMSDSAQFHTRINRELLPRLQGAGGAGGSKRSSELTAPSPPGAAEPDSAKSNDTPGAGKAAVTAVRPSGWNRSKAKVTPAK